MNVDAVRVSASGSKMNTDETIYQNGSFVNVDEVHNNTKNITLSGFNQEGGTVTGNIENLKIESKQNTSVTKGSSYSGSVGVSPSGTVSGDLSLSKTNGERRYVDTPSSFIVGENSNLTKREAEAVKLINLKIIREGEGNPQLITIPKGQGTGNIGKILKKIEEDIEKNTK